MTVRILAATAHGRRHAEHLGAALPAAEVLAGGRLREALATAWDGADALVLCMATGAALRLVAPHLVGKHRDPAVVTVDDAGRFAVALSGGHHGANELAARVAEALGATPVVTTASDALGLPALDRLGDVFGLVPDPDVADLAAVSAALLDGRRVTRWRARPWPTGPLPGNVVDVSDPRDLAPPALAVTDALVDVPRPAVVYRPRSLVVGVGASRGAGADEVGEAVDAALAEAGLSPRSVAEVATVEAKADEGGVLQAAAARGWPVVALPAGLLATVDVPHPSARVAAAVGTPSVAEAAALSRGGELVVAKRRSRPSGGRQAMATVAVARRPARGRLTIVGTGPGDPELVPPAARTALAAAEVAVGLEQYLQRARRWLRPGCRVLASPIGDELARARQALDAARGGCAVALVSGGDAGVYAMASPALELLGELREAQAGEAVPGGDGAVDVEVVPGISAAVAAAALLGSPLGHDHCAISLSDLLTPWEVIRRRIRAAAEGDFVVVFYNPRSRGRHWQLEEARLLLGEHRRPETPVGVVTDAYRPGQRVAVTTLAALDATAVGMRTTVVVGSSQTRVRAGRMVTPRGYR